MDLLIVARHGSYERSYTSENYGHLDEEGQAEAGALLERIKSLVGEKSLMMYHSPLERTSETAAILSLGLGVESLAHPFLIDEPAKKSQSRPPYEFPCSLRLVNDVIDQVDVMLLVAHGEHAGDFPRYFAQHVLNREVPLQFIEYAEASVLTIPEGVVSKI